MALNASIANAQRYSHEIIMAVVSATFIGMVIPALVFVFGSMFGLGSGIMLAIVIILSFPFGWFLSYGEIGEIQDMDRLTKMNRLAIAIYSTAVPLVWGICCYLFI